MPQIHFNGKLQVTGLYVRFRYNNAEQEVYEGLQAVNAIELRKGDEPESRRSVGHEAL